MNYFSHAYRFLDDPYLAAGTGVPDWLSVVDRPVRVRLRQALPLLEDPEPRVASIARGIVQHLRDDARFHETRAFAESTLQLTTLVRDVLNADSGFRPSFLGHLLVEVLLDASLITEDERRLATYYEVLEAVDGRLVEEVVNRMAARPTGRLAWMIRRFCQERILWDYLEDGKLAVRLNQVMRRVGLVALPDDFGQILPNARRLIDQRKNELLESVLG
jgi:hypothetical protein